jgi:hypothetical protein
LRFLTERRFLARFIGSLLQVPDVDEGNHSYATTVGKLDSALVRSSAGLLPPAEVSPVSAIAKERYEFPSRYMSLALTRSSTNSWISSVSGAPSSSTNKSERIRSTVAPASQAR